MILREGGTGSCKDWNPHSIMDKWFVRSNLHRDGADGSILRNSEIAWHTLVALRCLCGRIPFRESFHEGREDYRVPGSLERTIAGAEQLLREVIAHYVICCGSVTLHDDQSAEEHALLRARVGEAVSLWSVNKCTDMILEKERRTFLQEVVVCLSTRSSLKRREGDPFLQLVAAECFALLRCWLDIELLV